MKKITRRQLRNDSPKVLSALQEGQSMTVTKSGIPVAELHPVAARRFVSRAVLEEAARIAPRIDARRFRTDVDAVMR